MNLGALFAFDMALKSMKKGDIPGAVEKLTVRQWLTSLGLSKTFQTRFFDPAAIGILNDKPEVASAAGFIQALREMFFEKDLNLRRPISSSSRLRMRCAIKSGLAR